MKAQQCDIFIAVYGRYVIGLGIASFLVLTGAYWGAAVFLLAWFALRWAYARWAFPKIARFIGYGSVADEMAAHPGHADVRVTLYTAAGCPFCPIVEQRLKALQRQMGFSLEESDVTLRPQLITSKGFRAVPLVEVGERRLTGNATSAQLASLILGPQALPLTPSVAFA